MIFLVERDSHDLVHDVLGNVDLFGPLHFDDIMTYAMSLHECEKFGREVFLYEGASELSTSHRTRACNYSHDRFQPESS